MSRKECQTVFRDKANKRELMQLLLVYQEIEPDCVLAFARSDQFHQ